MSGKVISGVCDYVCLCVRALKEKRNELSTPTCYTHISWRPLAMLTSVSANADGPRDAASCKIDHIVLPTKYNYKATSVG